MNHCERRFFRLRSRSASATLTTLGLLGALVGGGCSGGDAAVRVLSLEPRHGHLTGEQPVNIGGQNFRTDIGYTVYFGTQPASRVIVQSPENLVAIAPGATEPGTVDVTVRGDDGTAVRVRQAYNYENMGGNVVQQLGDQQQGSGAGNLAY